MILYVENQRKYECEYSRLNGSVCDGALSWVEMQNIIHTRIMDNLNVIALENIWSITQPEKTGTIENGSYAWHKS